jgi:hypothetical protein
LAHLSERCNTVKAARIEVGRALRRVKFRGTLHVAEQDEPLQPITILHADGVQLALAL